MIAAGGFIRKSDLLIRTRKPKCRGGKDLGFLENGIKNQKSREFKDKKANT